ncbi:MAG: hypothetical protein ACI4VH_06150 [Clostridia bacterium]
MQLRYDLTKFSLEYAEGHVSHLYLARLSSKTLGWKVINVNNVSKSNVDRDSTFCKNCGKKLQ